ncbi:pyroglutamyl-peptidase I [Nocardia sp. NPDC052566]|uniref:pyroglutamyl-peptidase I n=1 Tax=Nocardia sp. NPDC052566 TaxID=3364330 RepID=UPI0037CC7C6E
MRTVLITGFEPFGGDERNPSWDVASLLATRQPLADAELVAAQLPCVFGAALTELDEAIAEHRPELVINVGYAAAWTDITLEKVAINLDDARIPDNAGAQPVDRPVVAGGPAAYLAGLPVKAAVAAVQAIGLPARVSFSAGTFVCNHVFYGLLHRIATERPGLRGGFVHVPPTLTVPQLADALTAVLRTCLDTEVDLAVPAGTLH